MGARLGFADVLLAKLADALPQAAPGWPGEPRITSPSWVHCLEPMRVASAFVLHQRYPQPASAAPAAAGIPMESTSESSRSGSPVPPRPERQAVCRSGRERLAIQLLNRLGASLSPTSTDEEVRSAYRQLIRDSHPDRHHGVGRATLDVHASRLRAVVQAWDVFQGRASRAA